MKDQIQISKELLERAINSLPSGHDLSDTKMHIQRALSEINHVESRRNKKSKRLEAVKKAETIEDKWKFEMNKGLVNPFTAKGTLSLIDQMIQDEQSKIDELKKPSEEPNENMGTILD